MSSCLQNPPEIRSLGAQIRVIREIGRGGMGRVFLAHHEVRDQRVVVKILDPVVLEGEDADLALRRFVDETRVLRDLKHPNLIGVSGAGVDGKLGPYLVCEYAARGSLRQRLDEEGPLGWERVRRELAPQMIAGLRALAGRGIVHRDLKPENVLIAEDGHFLIGDFGLALFSGRAARTATGIIVGTPAYMAPEQISRASEAHLSSTDLFSASLVWIESACGQLPDGEVHGVDLLRKRVSRGVTREELVACAVPLELLSCFEACLQADGEGRPGLDEVEEALNGKGVPRAATVQILVAREEGEAPSGARPTLFQEQAERGGEEDPGGPLSRTNWLSTLLVIRALWKGLLLGGLGVLLLIGLALWKRIDGLSSGPIPPVVRSSPRVSDERPPLWLAELDGMKAFGDSPADVLLERFFDQASTWVSQQSSIPQAWQRIEDTSRERLGNDLALSQLLRCRRLEESEGRPASAISRRLAALKAVEGSRRAIEGQIDGAAFRGDATGLHCLSLVAFGRAALAEGGRGDDVLALARQIGSSRRLVSGLPLAFLETPACLRLLLVLELLDFEAWGTASSADEGWRSDLRALLARAPAGSDFLRRELRRWPRYGKILEGSTEAICRRFAGVEPYAFHNLANDFSGGTVILGVAYGDEQIEESRRDLGERACALFRAYWILVARQHQWIDGSSLATRHRISADVNMARRLAYLRSLMADQASWSWDGVDPSSLVASAAIQFRRLLGRSLRKHRPRARSDFDFDMERMIESYRELLYRGRDALPVKWREWGRSLRDEAVGELKEDVVTALMDMHLAWYEQRYEDAWRAGERAFPYIEARVARPDVLSRPGGLSLMDNLLSRHLRGTQVRSHRKLARRRLEWYDAVVARLRHDLPQHQDVHFQRIDNDVKRCRELLRGED